MFGDDCNAAAAALCTALGGYGPFALHAAALVLMFVTLYRKLHRTETAVRSNADATAKVQAEVAETKALVSVRPPALNLGAPPVEIVPPPTEGGES